MIPVSSILIIGVASLIGMLVIGLSFRHWLGGIAILLMVYVIAILSHCLG